MNDFTKEELEWLRWEIEGGLIYEEDEMPFKLRNKIISMIDNYCEHEWKHRYDVSEYDECLKCGTCEL